MLTKSEVRREVRQRLLGACTLLSEQALTDILGSTEWQRAQSVLLYSSLNDEADTSILIKEAVSEGKRVILPVVDGEQLRLRVYSPTDAMLPGAFGIVEPGSEAEELNSYEEIDLAVIPGRAFTLAGERLGRGRGYYDRLLPTLHCPLWGLALPEQIYPELPTDPWDVRLDRVIY